MIIGVLDRIDVPVCVISEVRCLSSKIAVTKQELLRGRISSWMVRPCWASGVPFSSCEMQRRISKRARGTITAGLGVSRVKDWSANERRRRRRIDCGHARTICAAVEAVSFGNDRAMRPAVLIIVANLPHRALVAHILARP